MSMTRTAPGGILLLGSTWGLGVMASMHPTEASLASSSLVLDGLGQ